MPDYSAEIAELEELLNAATTSTNFDGTAVSYDLEAARKRLAYLKAHDDQALVRDVRPTISKANLGGAW